MEDSLKNKLRENRKRKLILIIAGVMMAAAIVSGIVMHSGDEHKACSASVEINCSQLSDNMDALKNKAIADYIPEDGMILPRQTVAFAEGATVYDVLESVCREKKIHLESSDSVTYGSRYIEGIGHLYEKDAGKMSGWTYEVNGELPNVGCSQYEVRDGDEIRWVYVTDYKGNDEGED